MRADMMLMMMMMMMMMVAVGVLVILASKPADVSDTKLLLTKLLEQPWLLATISPPHSPCE